MDDCTLEKLSVKPGKISPKFHTNTTNYSMTVASNIDNVTLDPLTSDTGASYSILGSDGSKTLPLKEGDITEIKIEVTAEDGTTKLYIIQVKRLSAKDASLSDLKLDAGTLSPPFSADVFSYNCLLPCNVASVTVTATAPDTKNEVTVCGKKPDSPSPLNVGQTLLPVEVISADGTNKQTYSICARRKQLPRYVKLTDSGAAVLYQCPFSLSALYCPITLRGSDPKHTFSGPLIDELTKTCKIDPLSGEPLEFDWRIEDYDLDKKMSALIASVPLTYGGFSDSSKLGELGSHVDKWNQAPKSEDLKDKFKNTSAHIKHTVQVRGWEKQLQQIYSDPSADKLVAIAKIELEKYYSSLPTPGQYKQQYEEGESPLDFLQLAAYCYASAIKLKGTNHSLHIQLGYILEEKYYAEDMFGLKKQDSRDDFPSLNVQAKESSKADECLAIAKLRGVEATAPIALHLKAIDEEYHHLLESGQSGKADHVMQLYAWKSKQASPEGAAAQKVSDEESPLGQAYLKYLDALTLDETKSMYSFHVGRLLIIQGSYEEAVPRLEVAINWNPQNQLARSYLGLALALKKDGPGTRAKEAIGYLLEVTELLLTQMSNEATSPEIQVGAGVKCLHAENLLRANNVNLLRGLIQLGRLVRQNQDYTDCMTAQDVFHTAALMASQVLPSICRGDAYKQIEWVLLEAHSNLLDILSSNDKGNEKLIAQRCHQLSSLIRHSTIPQNMELLNLQEKTCQKLVVIQPCLSYSLTLLGAAQFNQYENSAPGEAANRFLGEAKGSYLASVALEGKPAAGEPPQQLTEQQWWQQKVKQEDEKHKAGVDMAGTTSAGRGAATARGRGVAAPPARGAVTASARGRATRGAPATRGATRGTTPARAGAATRGAPVKPADGKTTPVSASKSGVKAVSSARKCEPSNTEAGKSSVKSPSPTENSVSSAMPAAQPSTTVRGPINKASYQSRLGLARVYRAQEETEKAQKYYQQVITMAPEVHDAYIEAAEMLMKADPLAAVDIYGQFPMSDNPSFDDAYISGEIIRMLIKAEKFDDPRLQTHLIAYGRVLGIGALEKYVEILDGKFKTNLLKTVYAGVNHKDVDHPDLQAFFKFKCWI